VYAYIALRKRLVRLRVVPGARLALFRIRRRGLLELVVPIVVAGLVVVLHAARLPVIR